MDKKRAEEVIHEVADAYEEIAAEFSDTRTEVWPELSFLQAIVADGMSIADIGCGNARMLKLFEGRHITYTGIDNSARLLAFAQTLSKQYASISARFEKGSILSLPLPNASCDIVLCIATLHHMPTHEFQLRAVKELYRILKPDGLLVLTNWNLAGQFRYWLLQLKLRATQSDLFRGFGFRDFRIPWKLAGGNVINRYYYAFSAAELAHLCTQAGFIVEHSGIGVAKKNGKSIRITRNILTLAKKS